MHLWTHSESAFLYISGFYQSIQLWEGNTLNVEKRARHKLEEITHSNSPNFKQNNK